MCTSNRARGFSLIEVVVFVLVLGIGIAAVVTLYGQLTKASVDPLVRKQALEIASSLLEEIELQPFTYCDPDDPAVFTATSAAGCAVPETIGPQPGETRYADPRFDNVGDYSGFSMTGPNILDMSGTLIPGLGGYAVSVSIVNVAAGELPAMLSTSDGLRITVTVTAPAGVSVALQGYRLRYAPNRP
jgi:MSHA pilin protein MshD